MNDALGSPQSLLLLGGTSEIGLAIVSALGSSRLRTVVLAGRDPVALERSAQAVRASGIADVRSLAFDAAATDTHQSFVDGLAGQVDDLDLVVLAFGVLGDQAAFEADPDEAVRACHVNYTGAVSIGLRIATLLEHQGHGTLVVLSSVAGERARKANFVYGSTKAGLDAFAQGLGDRLAGTGAHVMVVRPGFVRTRMTAGMEPAPLSTDAETVAGIVVDGLARSADVVWAPKPLRLVMSALRHLPRPIFRKVPG